MKSNTVFKRVYNQSLSLLVDLPLGSPLASESELAQGLDVSRTTVRAALSSLEDTGIVVRDGGRRTLARYPVETDYFPDTQTLSASAAVERRFMEWILQGNSTPGESLNTAELARQFDTSTTTIREHLAQFQHLGLLERRANGTWLFKGITPEFVREIYEVREMFELRATRRFVALSKDSVPWRKLDAIEQEHHNLLASIDTNYTRFPPLDERLHRIIHEASGNRFIIDFYDVMSILLHYTFQWNKDDEKTRSTTSLLEHLDYINALRSRDQQLIDRRLRKHLQTACAAVVRAAASTSKIDPCSVDVAATASRRDTISRD